MSDAAELMVRFGHLVAAHRKTSGMTQAKLAIASGISSDMIARIEGGGTGARFPNLQRLADALHIDPAELFAPYIPGGTLERPILTNLTAKLAGFSDAELQVVSELIDVAVKFRR